MRYKNIEEVKRARDVLSPPGDTLQSILDSRSLSQSELAKRMDKHKKTINEIVKGHSAITPETALELERTLGIDADFWLERDRRYQLQLAELNEAEKLINDKEWAKNFPLREMKQCGFLDFERNLISKTRSLLNFFGVSSKEGYKSYYGSIRSKYLALRISQNQNVNPHALTAWLRRGDIQADELEAADFDNKQLKKCLPDIKDVMAKQEADFFLELQQLCSDCGIRVVHTPKLPNAPVNGSTRWYRDKPLIQLSNRYQRNDIFWFTFFHEIGHIILHGKKDVFVEGFEYTEKGIEKEKEADEFAVKWTLSKDQEKEIYLNTQLDTDQVKIYAKKFNTHPAIIMGRFSHNAKSDYEKSKFSQIGWSEGLFKKIQFD